MTLSIYNFSKIQQRTNIGLQNRPHWFKCVNNKFNITSNMEAKTKNSPWLGVFMKVLSTLGCNVEIGVGPILPLWHTNIVLRIWVFSKIIYQPNTSAKTFFKSKCSTDIYISKICLHVVKVSISIWKIWYQLVYVFDLGINIRNLMYLNFCTTKTWTKKKMCSHKCTFRFKSEAWYKRFKKKVQ